MRQAPKEGKVRDKTANTVVEQWETTKEDFLQFLTDSLVVYEAFEKILHSTDELAPLRNSGMERVEGLKQDIAFIGTKYGLSAPAPSAAATEYAAFLNTIAVPVFVCHFYNYYFAHTAGGMRSARAAHRHAPSPPAVPSPLSQALTVVILRAASGRWSWMASSEVSAAPASAFPAS